MTNLILMKPIILTGFMGVGKTTIGQLLAKKLNYLFVDTDQIIEQQFKLSIPEIFKKYGEPAFRQAEKQCITEYCQRKKLILSLGGGAFLQEDIRTLCLEHGIVIHLAMSWPYWQQRLDLLRDSRPLLNNRSETEIKELFDFRQKVYLEHHLQINIDELNADATCEQILSYLTNRVR